MSDKSTNDTDRKELFEAEEGEDRCSDCGWKIGRFDDQCGYCGRSLHTDAEQEEQ